MPRVTEPAAMEQVARRRDLVSWFLGGPGYDSPWLGGAPATRQILEGLLMRHPLRALLFLSLACGPAAAATFEAPRDTRGHANAAFTAKPKAVKRDGRVAIRFAVSAPTDVEVAVLDARGKVVRHLAAGLLGPNAPAPFRKDALAQTINWDGKDDLGRAAQGGPFRVRVRAGSQARLEKYLGWDGNTLSPLVSLAVGERGELYVLMRSWVSRGRTELRVFDRDGKYLRTIMPYSAKTPPARTKSVGHLMVDGQRLPVVFSGHSHSLYPLTMGLKNQNMVWNPKGFLVVVSTIGTAFEHGLPRHLLAFHPEGGAPQGVPFVGPELRTPTGIMWGVGDAKVPCFDHLACSPDGKYVYYAPSTHTSRHAVFRLQWDEDKGAGVEDAFLGEDFHPGHDATHLNDPQGLATDRRGNIYVCDRGNSRVMIFNAKGETLGQFPCEDPEQIAVHPKTGAMYVACRMRRPGGQPKDIGPMSMAEYRRWKARHAERKARWPKPRPPKLLKFSAWKPGEKPTLLARLNQGVGVIALDPTASPPKLWARFRYSSVKPIVDRGDRFEVGDAINNGKGLYYPGYITPDPDRNRVLVQGLSAQYVTRAVDLATGEKKSLLKGTSEVAIAPDGSIYATGTYQSNALLRFSPDGKPLPFVGSDSSKIRTKPYTSLGLGLGQRGLAVAPNGDIYFVRAAQSRGVQARVDVYGPDGRLKRAALVDGMGIGDCGIGVDARGSIYLGANVKPKNKLYQAGFEKKVPATDWLCWAQWTWHYRPRPWYFCMRNEYLYHWGAVFKFGPAGGAFYGRGSMLYGGRRNRALVADAENAPESAPEYRSGYLYHRVKVVGAQWRYPGMGIVPSSERLWGDPSCVCMTSRLAVDPYGRVYAPNVFRFCIEMLDTNGNRIARVGRYGNADDRAGGIHFAWPAFVGVAGDGLYISDSVNRRIVALRMTYGATGECAVP